MTITTIDPPRRLYLSGAIGIHDEEGMVRKLLADLEVAASPADVAVIYVRKSFSKRLWIAEGDRPDGARDGR